MVSKAALNATATIAIGQGIAEMILDKYGMCINMRKYLHLEAVARLAEIAYRNWPGDISGKGLKRFQKIVKLFEIHVVESDQSLSALLSTGIALLESLSNKLTDRVRLQAINQMILAMADCYRDYDPDYEFDAGHEAAANLEKKWEEIVEAS